MPLNITKSLYRPSGGGQWRSQYGQDADSKFLYVTGSFGAKVASAPAIADDFSQYSDGQALIGGDWQEYQTNGGALIRSSALPHRASAKCAYSNWFRGQFATSYRHFPIRSKRAFVSYWVRVVDNYTHDYGVFKLSRLTSSTRTLASGGGGGGGVYNGVGCYAFSNVTPQSLSGASGQTSFTPVNTSNPSNNAGGTVLGNSPYQDMTVSGWVRIEGYVDLGTPDVADGRFYTRVGALSYNNYVNQPMASSAREFFLDTMLLGLDFANPSKWIHIPANVAANAVYSITYNSVTYSVNSGATPLTKVQIMQNLYTQLSAVLPTGAGTNGVFLSPDGTEIRLGDPNSGLAHSFSANMAYRAYGALISDVYVDYSRAGFYLTPTPTFDHATAEILKYNEWTTGASAVLSRFGGQSFTGDRYLHFVNDSEVPTLIGVR